eukprot:g5014.t1
MPAPSPPATPVKTCCLWLVKAPFYLVFGVLFLAFILAFLALWLVLTLSCLGPLLQILFSSCDRAVLRTLPPGVERLKTPQGYELAVRFTVPSSSQAQHEEAKQGSSSKPLPLRSYPVVLANGLGATMGTIGRVHDELVAAGFTVLSYDRLGVGFSSPNTLGRPPTVEECVRDMLWVLDQVAPPSQRWHVMGLSMGGVVAQAFIAAHPERVAGYMGMDGFVHGFAADTIAPAFEDKAASQYRMITKLMWTGLLRPFLALAGSTGFFNSFATPTFPSRVIKAQMNDTQFYGNIALEMKLMIALARSSSESWGELSLLRLTPAELSTMLSVQPACNGLFSKDKAGSGRGRQGATEGGDGKWESFPPAKVEKVAFMQQEEYRKAREDWRRRALSQECHSELGKLWARLPVRTMTGRNYDAYAGFYTEEMIDFVSAESGLHALLAADGERYLFPTVSHTEMFRQVGAILDCMVSLDQAAASLTAAETVAEKDFAVAVQ